MSGILGSGKECFSADLGTYTPRSLSNYFSYTLPTTYSVLQRYLSWDVGHQAPSSFSSGLSTVLMFQVKVCSEARLSHMWSYFHTVLEHSLGCTSMESEGCEFTHSQEKQRISILQNRWVLWPFDYWLRREYNFLKQKLSNWMPTLRGLEERTSREKVRWKTWQEQN